MNILVGNQNAKKEIFFETFSKAKTQLGETFLASTFLVSQVSTHPTSQKRSPIRFVCFVMNFSRNLNELEFEFKVFASELKLFRSVQKKESKLFPYLPESTSPFVSMGAANFFNHLFLFQFHSFVAVDLLLSSLTSFLSLQFFLCPFPPTCYA